MTFTSFDDGTNDNDDWHGPFHPYKGSWGSPTPYNPVCNKRIVMVFTSFDDIDDRYKGTTRVPGAALLHTTQFAIKE